MPETPTAARRMSTDEHRRRVQSGRYDCMHDRHGYCDAALYADWEREHSTNATVAAELRRIADDTDALGKQHSAVLGPGLSSATRMLRARADELDPPAGQED